MERPELLEVIAGLLLERESPHPFRVTIDGPDGAGKTTLANELAELLAAKWPVIRAGIDGFHNPLSRVRTLLYSARLQNHPPAGSFHITVPSRRETSANVPASCRVSNTSQPLPLEPKNAERTPAVERLV
jgi:hypothetical protein